MKVFATYTLTNGVYLDVDDKFLAIDTERTTPLEDDDEQAALVDELVEIITKRLEKRHSSNPSAGRFSTLDYVETVDCLPIVAY